METQRDSIWRHLVMTLISVAGMSLVVWAELPEGQRMWLALEAKSRAYRVLARAARAAGRAGMGRELRDDLPAAGVGYGLAYRLSKLRDRI